MGEHFVQTKCALTKKDAAADFKVVTYESHKRKAKESVFNEPIISVGPVDTRKGIDIKRARREIIKFGITGFSHERQQEAKVALAISLGARAPKKEYKNYRVLQEERRRQQRLDKKYAALQQAGKNPLGVSTARKKFVFNKAVNTVDQQKKKKGDLLEIYGKATIDTTPSKPKATDYKPCKRKRLCGAVDMTFG